jgi:dipeptidyl aminopeptidase/acylaminoacyl peptidase
MKSSKNISGTMMGISMLLLTASCVSGTSAPPQASSLQQSDEPAIKESPENVITETPHSVSIAALIQKEFNGSNLTLGTVLADNTTYTRYYVTYLSGELTISGIMNVPKGEGPFPVIILNHGYIDPAVYTNGRGLKREQDYLAMEGYVVIHPDFRNHASSDTDPDADLEFRLGYVEDTINAIYAVKGSDLEFFDKEHIGMLGHSMGGGVTINAVIVQPELIQAAVLFAPTNADAYENFLRWTEEDETLSEKIRNLYGTPDTDPIFWAGISAYNYLERISTPIQIHHGTGDSDVPFEWSDELHQKLTNAGKTIEYYTYEDAPHEFIADWPIVMRRTTAFFDEHLKE